MKISRRKFLKIAGLGGAAAAMNSPALFPQNNNNKLNSVIDPDYPFPYDSKYFDSSERVVFLDANKMSINVLPKEGMSLDIRIVQFQENRIRTQTRLYSGVNESLEVPITNVNRLSILTYRIEYREIGERTWKSTPLRTVKTPMHYVNTGRIEVILIGDDHTPDDADMGSTVLYDEELRRLRLNGDYVNRFIKKLRGNPDYYPEAGSEYAKLMNGFTLASTLNYIHKNENPDFIINLGDHRGGFGHKWPGLGLKDQFDITDQERDQYMKIFRLGTRKIYSVLSPEIPIYWALGNHDGEMGYGRTRNSAMPYRKKYFKLPGLSTGGSSDENYYFVPWGKMLEVQDTYGNEHLQGVLFVVLDSQGYTNQVPLLPEDWTLGLEQKQWLENILKIEATQKFVFIHHVLGGWPAGPSENRSDIAYGRGPLFERAEYVGLVSNPDNIEQVEVTQILKENKVDVVFYGHDHIFHTHEIGQEMEGKKLHACCVGSSKHRGELFWYEGAYWNRFYGDYGDYPGETNNADYWGPSGYTKLIIDKDGIRVDYIRSAYNHPFTNIPWSVAIGDIVQSVVFKN
jgi:3',5'-cyclic AMP phosphodiesterase CpdA